MCVHVAETLKQLHPTLCLIVPWDRFPDAQHKPAAYIVDLGVILLQEVKAPHSHRFAMPQFQTCSAYWIAAVLLGSSLNIHRVSVSHDTNGTFPACHFQLPEQVSRTCFTLDLFDCVPQPLARQTDLGRRLTRIRGRHSALQMLRGTFCLLIKLLQASDPRS